jgi:hypothetical protein
MAKLYEGREGQSKGSSGGRVQSLVDMRQVKAITKIQFPTKNPINKHPASKS